MPTQCFEFSQTAPVAKSPSWGQLGYCQKHMRHMAENSDFLYQDPTKYKWISVGRYI